METKKKQKGGNGLTILGMLLGGAIGAAVALVYSPSRGDDNRRQLKEWSTHRLDNAETWVAHRLGRGKGSDSGSGSDQSASSTS